MEIYLDMRYLMVLVPINPLVDLVNPYSHGKKTVFFNLFMGYLEES